MLLAPEPVRGARGDAAGARRRAVAAPLTTAALGRALERNEFVLHYQPKVDLRSRRVCGAEALLRWNRPGGGLVAPMRFVPLLEETGLIVDVGAWVLRQAARDHGRWQRQGLAPPRIAVNVSPLQLDAPDFMAAVRGVVADGSAHAPALELEITESHRIQDVEAAARQLRLIRSLGLPIALDDFGAGHSSPGRLACLPVDVVKVGRDFVMHLGQRAEAMAIVGAIVAAVHAMGLIVVAEGVETAQQLALLEQLGCDQMQGFLFSPGLPAPAFAELLQSGRMLA